MEGMTELLDKVHTKYPKSTQEEVLASELYIKKRNHDGPCTWDCPVCGGIGYLRNGDGTIRVCPRVDNVDLTDVVKFGLTPDEAGALTWGSIQGGNNKSTAVQLITGILGKGYGMLTLYGTYGSGKTTILKTAIAEILKGGKQAAYVSMSEILDDLREGFNYTDRTQNETARLKW